MKAIVIRNHVAALEDVSRPDTASECLIRVTRAGICGTDLELLRGYAGFDGVPGHEFVGIVEDAPVADRAWIGRRVVGEINVGCGTCDACRSRVQEHCPQRTVLGIRGRSGTFAEYVTLPAANLHEVPPGVDDDCAVFVEPVAACCRILEQVDVDTRDAAVIGDGRLGLLAAQVLRHSGARVRLYGRHPRKLAIATQLGIDVVTQESGGTGLQPRSRAAAKAAHHLYDIVVDATGRPEGFKRSLELVRPRGAIVMKSTFHGEGAVETWPLVVNEVRLIGSRCGPFAPALKLLSRGAVEVRLLIAGSFPLDDFQGAFESARGELKVLLRP
jgi:threonine dehydrogenase-like Zn-dependent dehydrogenase